MVAGGGSSDALDDLWAHRRRTRPAADAVYATLRDAIVAGHLRAGERLLEQQLARQFDVSRTPVREAIFRLEQNSTWSGSTDAASLSREVPKHELLEVYTVRAALDGLAARLAAVASRPADHARLRWLNARLAEVNAQGDLAAVAELNIQFHEGLSEAAHNTMLLHLVGQVHDQVRRFGATTFSVPGRASAALAEHAAIVEAIEAGASDLAELRAREHMAGAREARLLLLPRSAP